MEQVSIVRDVGLVAKGFRAQAQSASSDEVVSCFCAQHFPVSAKQTSMPR